MEITEEKVKLTTQWLRGVVWCQATNPVSRPVIEAMAVATYERDWASLAVLAEALERLEALTCILDANPAARGVAERAAAFARQAMAEKRGGTMTTAEKQRAAEKSHRGYAIKFVLDWRDDRHAKHGVTSEPTDENLCIVLQACARPPRRDEYPSIRRHIAVYRAELEAEEKRHDVTCPKCGTEEWDFTGQTPDRAQCVNCHEWDQAPDIPGTFVRPGYPGDVNDPERYPDEDPDCE